MFFKKKKNEMIEKKEFDSFLTKFIDELLLQNFKKNLNKREELENLRNKCINTQFDKEQRNALYHYIGGISGFTVNQDYIDLFIEEVESIIQMNFNNPYLSSKSELEKQIVVMSRDIRKDEMLLEELEIKIGNALEKHNKTEWHRLKAEKETLNKTILMKQNALNLLHSRNSNLKITEEAKEISKIHDQLNLTVNYVDVEEFQNIMETSQIMNDNMIEESSIINNSVICNNSLDDEFDKAYEEYILNKNVTSSIDKSDDIQTKKGEDN